MRFHAARTAALRGVAVVLAAAALAACAPNRKPQADAIDAAIKQLPGVASSSMEYDSGWPRGGERFGLTAVLRDNATPEQAEAVGKTFSDMVKENDFTAFDVALEVRYRVVDRMNNVPLSSVADFDIDHRSPEGLGADLGEWLAIAQSPGVQSAALRQPGHAIGITVDQAARDADLQTLVKTHPRLDKAEWIVVGGSPAETSIYAAGFPEVYRVRGMVPDEALRDVWTRIVAEVGAAGEVTAETDTGRKDVPTTVGLNFATSRDREQNLAQAWMVLPLLEKLPLPAKIDFDGAVFMMGGCSPRDAGSTSTPLEAELRQKYEKC